MIVMTTSNSTKVTPRQIWDSPTWHFGFCLVGPSFDLDSYAISAGNDYPKSPHCLPFHQEYKPKQNAPIAASTKVDGSGMLNIAGIITLVWT